MTKVAEQKIPDYSQMKNTYDIANALKDLKAQANKDKSVSKDQVDAFKAQVDKMGYGNISYSLNGNANTMDDSLTMMSNSFAVNDTNNGFSNAVWGAKLDGMIAEMDNKTDVDAQAAAMAETATKPDTLADLRKQFPDVPADKSLFDAVNDKLGKDIAAGADEATIKKDIANAYVAYNDTAGSTKGRNDGDYLKHLGEQFAKAPNQDPAVTQKWVDFAKQQLPAKS